MFTWQRVDEGGDFLHAPLRGGWLKRGGRRGSGHGRRRRPPRSPSRPTLHPSRHGDSGIFLSSVIVFLLPASTSHHIVFIFVLFCRRRFFFSIFLPLTGAPQITRLKGNKACKKCKSQETSCLISAVQGAAGVIVWGPAASFKPHTPPQSSQTGYLYRTPQSPALTPAENTWDVVER